MSWPTTAVAELRTLLSDQGTDRLRYKKRCQGRANGTNTKFQTLEFRRVTDLSTAPAPAGVVVVTVGNETVATVTADNPEVGEFTLQTAPANGAEVRATYYYQWFLDPELTQFLNTAATWMGYTEDYTRIPPQLAPAALQYAAYQAYQKLAIRWSENWSMIYKLEDAPKEPEKISDGYLKMADKFMTAAATFRKQYYTRQDQNEQPLFLFQQGAVTDPVPQR